MMATPERQLEFLGNLQRILNEGSFVATYKYALIRVLADLSVERSPAADGSLALPLDDLAERFIEVYWRQAAPFRGRRTLLAATGNQAILITRIAAIRESVAKLSDARRTRGWRPLMRSTKSLLLEQPLWRLQRVGNELLECLYANRLEDGAIRLKPGVAACFAVQFPVVQALVQLAWLRMVQQLPVNQELIGQGGDVAEFLFGADRSGLKRVGEMLVEVQRGICFYCHRKLSRASHVDHFIPWVRYPRDLGHNFVLAHDSCNSRKGDLLAGVEHLDRWLERNENRRSELDKIFSEAHLLFDAETSTHVAAWSYEQVHRAGGLVWLGGDRFEHLRGDWRTRFSTEQTSPAEWGRTNASHAL
ncbi:MAG TPA: HNH endonuclease [Burkholderiales bacterium]|nr:HNH endonuclease [Burkholderiales bacterium]